MALTVASDIGARLEDLRRTLGSPTWAALARRAGVKPKQMSEWRRVGGQRPPASRLEWWAARERWPIEIFSEGGRLPSEVLGVGNGEAGELEDGTREPAPDEGQFRDFLRNIERTARATIGDPTLWSVEEHRINQLGIVSSIMKKATEGGRPLPEWLPKIYNELVSGTFR